MTDGQRALHIKLSPRLLARVDACAQEEGLSRAEWCRTALATAADKSEAQAARRAKLARPAGTSTTSNRT